MRDAVRRSESGAGRRKKRRRRPSRRTPPGGRLVGFALPCALMLTGCLGTLRTPMEGGPRTTGGTVMSVGQTAPPRYREVAVEPLETRSVAGYEVLSLRMPSSGFNGQPENEIRARYHRALAGHRRALVVVVPAWGIAQYLAATLRRHVLHSELAGDVDVLQILAGESMFDWPAVSSARNPAELERVVERGVRSFQTMVADLRGLLVWAFREFDVDPRRVGIVGYSMGATTAIQVMALEPAIAAGIMVLPAASLHEVMASCGNNVSDVRREVLTRQGWTLEELTEWSEVPLSPIDPLRFASAIPPDRVLLVEAARDQCVPQPVRDAIWRSLGRPELITIDGGHRTSFLTMTPVGLHGTTRKLMTFLVGKLGEPVEVSGGVVVAGSR